MDLTERAAFRVTRDGDTEISDDADDLLEAVESELRKRRFGAVVRLEVSSSISRAMVARLAERLAVRPDAVYPVHGLLDLREVMQLYDLDRPDLKYEPWVPQTQRRLAKPKDGDLFAEIALARHRRAAPVRLVRDERRGVRARRREGSGRRDAEDDRLPHEPRLGARAGADRGGRERQAERLHRRAEGALRRAPQHRVVALARAGRRPRRLRLPRPEDPREDDARDPRARATGSSATSTSAPATTTRRRRGSTRTSACSPPTPRSRPTSPTCSTSSPASAGRRRSARSSSRRSTCAASSSSASAGRRRRGGRRARADPDQGQQPRRPRDRRGALQGVTGGAEIDLIVRAVCVAAARRRGAVASGSGCGRSSAGSSSTAGSTASRPATRSYLLGSADLMPRNLDHRIEMVVPVEAAARPRRDRDDLPAAARRQLAGVGRWPPTAPGRACSPRTASAGAPRRSSRCGGARARRRRAARRRGLPTCGAGIMGPCRWRDRRRVEHGPAAHVSRDGEETRREKEMLRLGEAIERDGAIPAEKLDETARVRRRLRASARGSACGPARGARRRAPAGRP